VSIGFNPEKTLLWASSSAPAKGRRWSATPPVGLPTKLLVREHLTALPDEKLLAAELEKTRKQLESRP
jgi:hypothetical protein